MIKKVSVLPGSRASKILFFTEADFTQLPYDGRLVLLFGPNGVGKSTLLNAMIKSQSKLGRRPEIEVGTDRPSAVFSYSNSTDNFKDREPRSYAESFDPGFVSAQFDARHVSEGQSVLYSVFDLIDALKTDLLSTEGANTVVVLDEIDSGLSIDNIDIVMRKIKYALSHNPELQVIMSFNSPRVLKHCNRVLSMYDGTVLELNTDDDMLAEIQKHKKVFDKARKNSRGRPKVFA